MSSMVPPDGGASTATPASPTPSIIGDEDALHRVFLAEYHRLIDVAHTALGEAAPALGPHVVEGAFVRAWDARERFATMEELHDFLVNDVHHAAARALSRRAIGHRAREQATPHVAHDVPADPDRSWEHVRQALQVPPVRERAMRDSVAAARHEAAEHISAVERTRPRWIPVVLLAALALVVWGAMRWVDRVSADSRLGRAVVAPDARVITSGAGQIGEVPLDDGSSVRLAPESQLSIPKDFGPALRAVKLEGAAAFTVAARDGGDFRVYAGPAIVVATGTRFTVRAYPPDSAVTVVVTDGTVEVRGAGDTRAVAAGSSLYLPAGGQPRAATAAERDAADSWRTGTMAVTGAPLERALAELRRWYGLDIRVRDTALLSRRVSLRASLDSSSQAIRALERETGLVFGYDGSTMILAPPEPAAAPRRR